MLGCRNRFPVIRTRRLDVYLPLRVSRKGTRQERDPEGRSGPLPLAPGLAGRPRKGGKQRRKENPGRKLGACYANQAMITDIIALLTVLPQTTDDSFSRDLFLDNSSVVEPLPWSGSGTACCSLCRVFLSADELSQIVSGLPPRRRWWSGVHALVRRRVRLE